MQGHFDNASHHYMWVNFAPAKHQAMCGYRNASKHVHSSVSSPKGYHKVKCLWMETQRMETTPQASVWNARNHTLPGLVHS